MRKESLVLVVALINRYNIRRRRDRRLPTSERPLSPAPGYRTKPIGERHGIY